jgi:hypothetical protein
MHFLLLFAFIVDGSPHKPSPPPWSLCGLAEEQGWGNMAKEKEGVSFYRNYTDNDQNSHCVGA